MLTSHIPVYSQKSFFEGTTKEYFKQYNLDHKEHKQEYFKQYNLEHKEEQKQYFKEHYLEQKKIKFTCECGSICILHNKSCHLKTKKHLEYVSNI